MISLKRNILKATIPAALHGCVTGMVTGYILALLLSQWTWFEMRCNLSRLIPAGAVLGFLLVFWRRFTIPYIVFLLLQIAFFTVFIAAYWFQLDALLTIPASMWREGFDLQSIRVGVINTLLGAFFLLVNLLWIGSDLLKTTRGRH